MQLIDDNSIQFKKFYEIILQARRKEEEETNNEASNQFDSDRGQSPYKTGDSFFDNRNQSKDYSDSTKILTY